MGGDRRDQVRVNTLPLGLGHEEDVARMNISDEPAHSRFTGPTPPIGISVLYVEDMGGMPSRMVNGGPLTHLVKMPRGGLDEATQVLRIHAHAVEQDGVPPP